MNTGLGISIALTGLVATAAIVAPATGQPSSSSFSAAASASAVPSPGASPSAVGYCQPGGGTSAPCSYADLLVYVSVVGSGPTPPGGWMATLSSSNCQIPSAARTRIPLMPGGGAGTGILYAETPSGAPCVYTVTEDPYPGWTTTYNPPGGTIAVPIGGDFASFTLTVINTAPSETSGLASHSSTSPVRVPNTGG